MLTKARVLHLRKGLHAISITKSILPSTKLTQIETMTDAGRDQLFDVEIGDTIYVRRLDKSVAKGIVQDGYLRVNRQREAIEFLKVEDVWYELGEDAFMDPASAFQ